MKLALYAAGLAVFLALRLRREAELPDPHVRPRPLRSRLGRISA